MFNDFYESDESVFLGAAAGSGKTVCAELAILRQLRKRTITQDINDACYGKIVYVTPVESTLQIIHSSWAKKFSAITDIQVVKLTGTIASDLKLLKTGDLIISSIEHWDAISRRWAKRKNVQKVSLFIADEIHLLPDYGALYEVIVSRMRYMSSELEKSL